MWQALCSRRNDVRQTSAVPILPHWNQVSPHIPPPWAAPTSPRLHWWALHGHHQDVLPRRFPEVSWWFQRFFAWAQGHNLTQTGKMSNSKHGKIISNMEKSSVCSQSFLSSSTASMEKRGRKGTIYHRITVIGKSTGTTMVPPSAFKLNLWDTVLPCTTTASQCQASMSHASVPKPRQVTGYNGLLPRAMGWSGWVLLNHLQYLGRFHTDDQADRHTVIGFNLEFSILHR